MLVCVVCTVYVITNKYFLSQPGLLLGLSLVIVHTEFEQHTFENKISFPPSLKCRVRLFYVILGFLIVP